MSPTPRPSKRQDLTGNTIGRLTVLTEAERRGAHGYRRYWLCKCDCGIITEIPQTTLLRNPETVGQPTQSCGCLQRERTGNARRTHGMSTTADYRVWTMMRDRCYNPNNIMFPSYGARGITVCESWSASFEAFYADMGPRPTPLASLERVDNDAPYSPENCVWASRSVQNRNKRTNRTITFAGKTQPLCMWEEDTGIKRETIAYRINAGWSIERTMTTPVRG